MGVKEKWGQQKIFAQEMGEGWGKAMGRRREERVGEREEREGEKKGNLPPLEFRSGYATGPTVAYWSNSL